MRTLLIGGAVAATVLALAACGGSGASSAADQTVQRQGEFYAIDQIERNWHEAISKKDIEQMMSLWAPNATFTVGPGMTLTGKKQIRRFWLKDSHAWDPSSHWLLDTPAYKIRETVNGDRGTLYFECDHIDLDTRKVIAVTAAD